MKLTEDINEIPKYLKGSCGLGSDQYFSFKHFPKMLWSQIFYQNINRKSQDISKPYWHKWVNCYINSVSLYLAGEKVILVWLRLSCIST